MSALLEWLRPAGIGLVVFMAHNRGGDAVAQFHIMGPLTVIIMSGSVAFESLFLGEAASRKIGYGSDRAYQVQSGLANAAIAITALLVYLLEWGRHADAAIATAMLLFFALSAGNHVATAVTRRNMKTVNLLRPVLALLLIALLLPPMIEALNQ